jgi:glycosyltransferase involved in cell wall biosynthesis
MIYIRDMKVVYMCTYEEIASGGDSRVAWELARYMAGNTDHEVWMVCPGKEYSIKRDKYEPSLMVRCVKSTYVTEGVSIFAPTVNGINRLYKIFKELKPDVVHAHNIDPLSFIAQAWCSSHGVPFVYTGHLLATKFNEWQAFDFGRALKTVVGVGLDVYTSAYYDNCTKIICLNEYAREDFEEFTKTPEKLEVIPNGNIFVDIPKNVNIEKDREIQLMFPGYVCERKNQMFLLEALKHLKTKKKVKLILPGSFQTDSYERDFKRAISTLPDNREIELPGYVDHDDVLKMFGDTHYFVSAALAEVQSLSVIEALASGTPVIGLANTTTVELVKDGVNGSVLSEKSTPEEFAKVLDKYLNVSNREYDRLSEASKKSVEFLDYRNVSKQFSDLYIRIVKENGIPKRKNRGIEYVRKFFSLEENIKATKKMSKKSKHGIFLGLISAFIVVGVALIKVGKGFQKVGKKKK